MESVRIPNYKTAIGPGRPVFIIAEIGKNFIQTQEDRPVEEYLKNAKELVRLAKEAGANAVKFQTHRIDDEQANLDITYPHFKGSDRYRWVKRNTLATPRKFWRELKKYCDQIGIVFHSTPMSRAAAQLLESIGNPLWKVGSGDILDFVTLDFMAKTKKPVIISSGMSTLKELDQSIAFLQIRKVPLVLLHCVSKYPCPAEDLHLKTISFFKKRYSVPVGFSDHSIGLDSALAAVALGAVVIEKHFSLRRDLYGADHKVSMTPDELKALVKGIREIEKNPTKKKEYLSKDIVKAGMGKSAKTLQKGEMVFRPLFRKTLVALADIPAGTKIRAELIGAMRPQAYLKGLPSEKYEYVLGKKTLKKIKKYQPITEKSLSNEVIKS